MEITPAIERDFSRIILKQLMGLTRDNLRAEMSCGILLLGESLVQPSKDRCPLIELSDSSGPSDMDVIRLQEHVLRLKADPAMKFQTRLSSVNRTIMHVVLWSLYQES